MVTILVVYHSQKGSTRRLAEALAAGVDSIPGARAVLREALQTDLEDLLNCDGLALGSPEYFGYMAGALKDFFDRTYEAARGQVFRKPYVAFVKAGNDGSMALGHIDRICIGYQFKRVAAPVVAVGKITPEILERCRELGQTIAAGCEAGIY